MNYITTNIRIPEEDYLKLKEEAAKRRVSLSAVIRERVSFNKDYSTQEVEDILEKTKQLAKRNAPLLKGVDGTTVIREMRDTAKW